MQMATAQIIECDVTIFVKHSMLTNCWTRLQICGFAE